jgi:hypothetical protein
MIADADKCLFFDYIYKEALSLLYNTSCVEVNEELKNRLSNQLSINIFESECLSTSDNDRYICLNYHNLTEVNRIYNSCGRPSIKCPIGNNSQISICDLEIIEINNGVNCSIINLTEI